MPIRPLLPFIRSHFDGLADRLGSFHRHEFQAESWFKGELIYALERGAPQLGIQRLDREVKIELGRIDVAVHLASGPTVWIELKHWHMGRQRGQLWTFTNTVRTPESFGLEKDLAKLTSNHCAGSGFALLLLTANPGTEDWKRGLDLLRSRIAPAHLEPLTNPADFPPSHFLSVLRACTSA